MILKINKLSGDRHSRYSSHLLCVSQSTAFLAIMIYRFCKTTCHANPQYDLRPHSYFAPSCIWKLLSESLHLSSLQYYLEISLNYCCILFQDCEMNGGDSGSSR
jgi:hypothetical protein